MEAIETTNIDASSNVDATTLPPDAGVGEADAHHAHHVSETFESGEMTFEETYAPEQMEDGGGGGGDGGGEGAYQTMLPEQEPLEEIITEEPIQQVLTTGCTILTEVRKEAGSIFQ